MDENQKTHKKGEMLNNHEMRESQIKVLNAIKESYSAERLVPFIGSGVSKSVEGFLTWDEFIQKLSEKLPYLNKFKEEYPSITDDKYFLENKFKGGTFQAMSAEYYALTKLINDNGANQKVTRDALRGIIQDEIQLYLNPGRHVESNIHKILLDMFSYIYTTNWDNLFEYVKNDKPLEPIFSIGKISELWDLKKRDKKILIKMHGTCDEADSIIALETDYWDLLQGKHKNIALNNLFECDIMQRDFLFIGFSFTDLNIVNLVYIINNLKENLSHDLSQTPKLFLVLLDDYDYFLERYYLDIKGVDVYFIRNVSEKGNSKTKAIQKFLYRLELSRLNKLNKDENKESKIKEEEEPLTQVALEEKIKKLDCNIKKDFIKFEKEKRISLKKKKELLEKDIKSLEDEKLNKEDCEHLKKGLNSLKEKSESENFKEIKQIDSLLNNIAEGTTYGSIKEQIDLLNNNLKSKHPDDNDINNSVKSLKEKLEDKFPYNLIKEFKKNLDETKIELEKYKNKKN